MFRRGPTSSSLPIIVACLCGGAAVQAQDLSGTSASSITVPLPPALSPGGYAPPQPAVPEGVGVADRPRQDYLPIGGRLGSFFLYPDAAITTGLSDNIRATQADRMGDSYLRVSAGTQLVSGFSRHKVKAGLFVSHPFYLHHPQEGITQYGGSLDTTLDLDRRTQADVMFTAGRSIVDRTDFTSPPDATSPIAYDHASARLNLTHGINRLTLSSTAKVTGTSYRHGRTDSGALISQTYRDMTAYDLVQEARYTLHPGFDAVLHVSYNRAVYALPASDPAQPGHLARDASGWTVQAGARLGLTGTLYGELRLGYLWRDYADPRLRAARGFSFDGNLLWNAGTLTSVRLRGSRSVEEAASTTAAGNLVTMVSLGLDHELQRNIIISAEGGYLRLAPIGTGATADLWSSRLSARYLISRRISLTAQLGHAARSSVDVSHAFVANTASLSLSITL
ncbi:MAG: outer membrane beta-barrel protein [Sphingomonadales bacterium]|nr:outer membrane beta-barrel protein [Sphingomonadales bacterium]MDE2168523.1 outer membrane beta-barrel protein [Sphingomonadales bacterium]